MALRLVVPMEAAPGKRDELVRAFRTRAPEVRQESGCQEYELYQSTERPDQLVLLERWTDQPALEAHLEMNRQRGFDVSPLRARPTQAERYTTQG